MESINIRQVLPTQCFIIMINLFNFYSTLTRGHHFTEHGKSHHNLTYWTMMKVLVVYLCYPENADQKCTFAVCSMWTTKKRKMLGVTPTSKKVGSPCAIWCTTQVGSAQHRLIMHNVALCLWNGAPHRFHKSEIVWFTLLSRSWDAVGWLTK